MKWRRRCGVNAKTITNVDEETVEKAVCLILNSTPAKLGMILRRKNKTFSYVSFARESLNRVAMPFLYGMRPSAFRALAKVYDAECQQSRERLPQAHECRVQLAIDQAVCRHTGYPEKLCREARRMLSYEPMVTGKRYQADQQPTNPKLFDDTRATRGDGGRGRKRLCLRAHPAVLYHRPQASPRRRRAVRHAE